ncbi:MAG: glycosyltransferase family 39 protein [Kiritimatiellia bacterium]
MAEIEIGGTPEVRRGTGAPSQLLVGAVLTVFAGFALYQWHLPGVYYDEVILSNQAFDILSGKFPLAGNVPYVGSLKGYLHAPLYALFPGSVPALRALPVALTLLSGGVYARFVRDLLGSAGAGATAAALTLLHPTILFSVRVDDGPVSTLFLLEVLVLYSLHTGIRTESPGWIAAAGIFTGLGIWQKTYFLWLPLSLLLMAPLILRITRTRLRGLLLFGLCSAIGALPLLVHNLLHDWPLLHYPADTPDPATWGRKLHRLQEMALGTERGVKFTGHSPGVWALTFVPFLCAVALAPWLRFRRQIGYILGVMILLTLFAVIPAISGWNPRHYVLLMPLFALPIVMAYKSAAGHFRTLFSVLILTAVISQTAVTAATYQLLRDHGGRGVWSESSTELADALDPDITYIALDWGIRETLRYLTADRVRILEPEWVFPGTPASPEQVLPFLRHPAPVRFLSPSPARTVFPQGYTRFETALKQTGLTEVVEQRILEKSGAPLYRISRTENPD